MVSLRRSRAASFRISLCVSTLACLALLLVLPPRLSEAFEPWWVQTHTETELWSGPDSNAVSFGTVAQWSYFLVMAPQSGPRLHVLNPATRNYAYIDASAVGPSSEPPSQPAPPAPEASPPEAPAPAPAPSPAPLSENGLPMPPALPPGYEPWWVSNFEVAELWAGPEPDATSFGTQAQFRRFMVIAPQQGSRLLVWSPESNTVGYLDAALAGPSGPSIWMTKHSWTTTRQINLPGRSLGGRTFLHKIPLNDDESAVLKVPHNTAIYVKTAVTGDDGREWYELEDGSYILAEQARLPQPVSNPLTGRWIYADLNEPAMVTAYEDGKAVYSALAIKGVTSFSTPRGVFEIFRRVEDETMDSETITPPIPRNAPGGYYLKNVLYTQYFSGDGSSLHYNYWTGVFGYPGSHGCLGLNLTDAKWFWDWATIGTRVVIP